MKLTDDRVTVADDVIGYLLSRVSQPANPMRDRYIGFCAVTAATHVETTAKELIIEFCHTQNQYLHTLMLAELRSFNARISYQDLCKSLGRFDPVLERRFKNMLKRLNKWTLRSAGKGFDLLQAYQSLLDLRHSFVHNLHANFSQVTATDLQNYIYASKRIICAFGRTLSI